MNLTTSGTCFSNLTATRLLEFFFKRNNNPLAKEK